MGLGTTARQSICLLYFNATAHAGFADNTATSPVTTLPVSGHTADPTSGNQTTSEASYTGYSRGTPARTSGGYSCTAGVATNVATVSLGACSGGSNTLTHAAVGKSSSGTGEVLCAGALTASLAVSSGITPQFSASALSVTWA